GALFDRLAGFRRRQSTHRLGAQPQGGLWMNFRRLLTVAIALSLGAAPAGAAPQGKVVIAQGVDPTTLDTMNQQETPASVVAAHLFDTLVERDPNLKLVPALAAEMPKLVAPQVWEVK